MNNVKELLIELKEHKGEVYFRPNHGNAGDALINMGFFSLAQSIGFEFKVVTDDLVFETLADRDVVILPGGGYIVPYWHGGSQTLQTLLQFNFPIYMMPQSIEGRKELLCKLREKDKLFLRDDYSREYAASLNLDCKVDTDHDLAFFLDQKFIAETAQVIPPINFKNIVRVFMLLYHFIRSFFFKSIKAYRTDSESVDGGNWPLINDLSLISNFGTRSLRENAITSKWFLRLLSWYNVVETDRLHVMIGCVLVGTKVRLLPNKYYKITGVYEYTIKNNPKLNKLVEWIDCK